jgi:hypothetical protein
MQVKAEPESFLMSTSSTVDLMLLLDLRIERIDESGGGDCGRGTHKMRFKKTGIFTNHLYNIRNDAGSCLNTLVLPVPGLFDTRCAKVASRKANKGKADLQIVAHIQCYSVL